MNQTKWQAFQARWAERDLTKKFEFEHEVGPSFNYAEYLSKYAKRAIGELVKVYPRSPCEYRLPHPFASNDDDVWEDARYPPVGRVYFRTPYHVPVGFLSQLGGDTKKALALCPAIERIELHPALQRRGFIYMLARELRAAGFRYLIVSSVANKSFARHLYSLSNRVGSSWQLLYPAIFETDGEINGLSTFSLNFRAPLGDMP